MYSILIYFVILLNTYSIANAMFYTQIMDLRNGQVYTYPNSNNHYVMLASSQKIFTAFAAFNILGEDFQFETQIRTNGKVQDGILYGNINIKLDSNPDLNNKHIFYIAQKLKALGIHEIKGYIILDISEFDNQPYPHGWTIENQNMCYNAPFTAAIINKNCSMLSVKKVSNKLTAEPIDNLIQIDSEAIYDPKNCDLNLSYQQNNNYLLTGKCNVENELHLKVAVRSPLLLLQQLIAKNFHQTKIKYQKIHISSSPNTQAFQILFSIKSRPLWAIMRDVLVKSDNLLSEVLIKKIGSLNGEGSWKRGSTMINLLLQRQIGITDNKVIMADGSGLSRKNLFNLNTFSAMLSKLAFLNYHTSLYNSQSIAQSCLINTASKYIINNLVPINHKGFSFNQIDANKILIKTGGIDGVRVIAGYLFDCNSIPIYSVIAVINNSYFSNKTINIELAKNLEQIICQLDPKNCFFIK